MNVKFIIDPDTDSDEYRELYTAEVTMEDGTEIVIRATEDDLTFADFKADIFEDLFRSMAEASEIEVTIEIDDYADELADPAYLDSAGNVYQGSFGDSSDYGCSFGCDPDTGC